MSEAAEKRCPWCGWPATGADMFGLCEDCFWRAKSIPFRTPQQLDALPFGAIELDAEGTILHYNRTEQEMAHVSEDAALGNNFFTDIAPCTNVREFKGRFRDFLQGAKQAEHFRFVFPFRSGSVGVLITFLRDTREGAFVIVKREAVA